MNTTEGFDGLRSQIHKLRQQLDADGESIDMSSFSGSSVANTDYNFALKRFLSDAETVIDEDENAPIQTAVVEDTTGTDSPQAVRPASPDAIPESSVDGAETTLPKCPRNDGCILYDAYASSAPTLSDLVSTQVISKVHLWGYNLGALVMPSPMQHAFYAVALYRFAGSEPDELPLEQGDVVRIYQAKYKDWSYGRLGDKVGIFPHNYVAPCDFKGPESHALTRALRGHSLISGSIVLALKQAISTLSLVFESWTSCQN